MDLKWIAQMAERINELEKENKHLKGLLEECENKREPDMTKPQPCTKFCNAGTPVTMKALTKLSEETHEVIPEATDMEELLWLEEIWSAAAKKDRLAMELTDVITVCVSWLHSLGYDEYMRGELHRHVNEKNKARGYF